MAMLRVMSDALTAAGGRHVTLLGLLDMSAAFDCVDMIFCSSAPTAREKLWHKGRRPKMDEIIPN